MIEGIYNSKYEEHECIGKGQSAYVYKVQNKYDKKMYAAKHINLAYFDKQRAMNEINILNSLDHPHILKFVEFFETDCKLILISEYCNDGDLKNYLSSNKGFNELKKKWILQLIMTLNYIHKRGIIHRDLKPSNIFISSNKLKIGDFGVCK